VPSTAIPTSEPTLEPTASPTEFVDLNSNGKDSSAVSVTTIIGIAVSMALLCCLLFCCLFYFCFMKDKNENLSKMELWIKTQDPNSDLIRFDGGADGRSKSAFVTAGDSYPTFERNEDVVNPMAPSPSPVVNALSTPNSEF
jgi:hypothetical protein